MDQKLTREVMYPIYHQSAVAQLAAGTRPEELRAEMPSYCADADEFNASIICEAYEDALAGRPSRV